MRTLLSIARANASSACTIWRRQHANFRKSVVKKSGREHWVKEKVEAMRQLWLRKLVMLKGFMLVRRAVDVNVLGIRFPFVYTWSALAGHGSFLFLAASYLETDLFQLRVFAIGGITLSVLFQYYREIPLWIPIRWNLLFLVINAAMVGLILKESHDFHVLSEEQLSIYRENFEKLGMKPIDFLHIITAAERKEYSKGEKLIDADRENTLLHFVCEGTLAARSVTKNVVYEILRNQFVGARSFLGFEGAYRAHQQVVRARDAFSVWNSNTENLFVFSEMLGGKHEDAPRPHRLVDVTCEDRCVVYTWSFENMHALLSSEPAVGAVFEMCILLDLNKKMTSSQTHETLARFRQLLECALLDSTISQRKKDYLCNIQRDCLISDNQRNALLQELGWTVEEYDKGRKQMGGYKALLQRLLIG